MIDARAPRAARQRPDEETFAGGSEPPRRTWLSRLTALLATEHRCHPYGISTRWQRFGAQPAAASDSGGETVAEIYLCPECGQRWQGMSSEPGAVSDNFDDAERPAGR